MAAMFWLMVAGLFGCFWLVCAAVFFIGRKTKSRVLSWLGGLPLLLGTGGAVWFASLVFAGYSSTLNPANVYEMYFGARPSADVSAMKSSFSAFGDYETSYLKFNAAPSTISRITAKGWKRLSARQLQSEDFSQFRSDETPAWWTPTKSKTSRVYEADKRLGHFSSLESEILVYDEASGQAFYSYDGID